MPRLSRSTRRQAERHAAEEFFRRRHEPPTQARLMHQSASEPDPVEHQGASGLPPSGAVLDIDQSKEILKRLASGELKQQRRR